MQSIISKSLLWVGALTATIALAGAYILGAPAHGVACKTTPCTYVNAKTGESFDGKCGAKKTDTKHCYCFDSQDKKLSEIQEGCTVKK